MKRIILCICLLLSFYVYNVSAQEYSTVNVITFFDENVKIDDIPKINLSFYAEGIDYVDDVSTISLELELSKDNNYSTTANNVKIVDKSNLFAMVDKDKYGKYNCSIEMDTSTPSVANITINVTENTYVKDENVSIPKNMLDSFVGNMSTTKKIESSDEVVIGSKTTTTTHKATQKVEEMEKQKQKEKNRKKNNIIITILFSTLGIFVLIVSIFVVYKFINANK